MDCNVILGSLEQNITFRCLQSMAISRLLHPQYVTVLLIMLCKISVIYVSVFWIYHNSAIQPQTFRGIMSLPLRGRKDPYIAAGSKTFYQNSNIYLAKHIVLRTINPLSKCATEVKMSNL